MGTDPQESSDLLAANTKPQRNGNARLEEVAEGPPDGGLRAYAVLLGSFLTNGLLFGVINSYSVIYIELEKQLQEQEVSNPQTRASLVGALAMGAMFALSPVSGVLAEILGLRLTAVLGGSLATASLLMSSFFTHSVDTLCFTYGILYGMGASFAYTPSLAILSHYFKKRLGLANGIATIGSSVFTIIYPPLMEHILKNYGLPWLFRLLALFVFVVALCGLLFKPSPSMVVKPVREDDSGKSLLKSIINTEIWRNRHYRFWALSMPVALCGYFVPYVHIKKFMEATFKNVKNNLPLQCIAFASGVGRLVFGFISDRPGVDRIMLQQISFYVIGTLTIILPFVRSFPLLVALSLGMGIFDGAFISLIGPISVELCGPAVAAQAIGCMLGLAALPLSIGPPVAGFLYEVKKNYTLPFVLAGICPLVGATLMFAIRIQSCCRRRRRRPEANGHVVAMTSTGGDEAAAKLTL